MSQETGLDFRCSKDYWLGEELDSQGSSGNKNKHQWKDVNGNRLGSGRGNFFFFFFTFKAVWNAMRLPCGVENTFPCKSSRGDWMVIPEGYNQGESPVLVGRWDGMTKFSLNLKFQQFLYVYY